MIFLPEMTAFCHTLGMHHSTISIMDEFGDAELGDPRRRKRLQRLAQALAEQPAESIPQATGNWGQACGAYRFFDNKAIGFEQLLAPHHTRTRQRASGLPVVLAVSDTTSLNYDQRPATDGLGPLRTRADKTLGLWLHSLVAFTPAGTPLGLLQAECWSRDPAQFGSRHRRKQKATAEKESGKWLRSLTALQQTAAQTAGTQWVFVADREADLYDLFVAASAVSAGPALLVRARHDRRLPREQRSLFAHLTRAPVLGQIQVAIPRRPRQPARTATLVVRVTDVQLWVPEPKRARPALRLCAIEARELHPPRGVSPIHWRLLTTLVVRTLAEAEEKLRWYCGRWGIEVFHKVLKSRCAVEELQLQTAERLRRCLALKLVVAWSVLAVTELGREQPTTPLSEILEETQWRVLQAFGQQRDRPAASPAAAPRLSDGVRWLGRLGGHLGRRGDGPPGPLCLARGLERLHDLVLGWQMAQRGKTCA